MGMPGLRREDLHVAGDGVEPERRITIEPPRVEYRLTPMGERLNGVLDAIEALPDDTDRAWPL
jgi:hypothetical protein